MNDEDQIKENLKEIPHCFVLNDCLRGKSKDYIRQKIEAQMQELDNEIYEFDHEVIRTRNFISYLYWITGDKEKALTNNTKVIEMEQDNLVAIANKIWFCLETDDAYELNIVHAKMDALKRSPDFAVCLLKADAELAYCYTRLGLKQQENGRRAFQKVVDQIDNLNPDSKIDNDLIYLWKYGLGLITRRISKLHCSRSAEQVIRCNQRRKEAIQAFLDVIEGQWGSNRLKAMAYAQLGEIYFAVSKDKLSIREFFSEPYDTWDEEMFYKTAVGLFDTETYILERYGQFLRYKKKYDESENMLRSSIAIRPTSHAHHHLALTLKSKFHKDLAGQNRGFQRTLSSPYQGCRPRRNFRRMQSEGSRGKLTPHVRDLFGDESHGNSHFQTNGQQRRKWRGPNSRMSQRGSSRGQPLYYKNFPSSEAEGGNIYCGTETRDSIPFQSSRNLSCESNFEQDSQPDSGVYSLEISFEQMSLQGSSEEDSLTRGKLPLASGSADVATQSNKTTCSNKDLKATQPNMDQGKGMQRHHIYVAQAMIKSPKKPLHLPEDDDRTRNILDNLEKALCLSENNAALYDKGLTLRAMQHFDEAVNVFKQLITGESSLIYLANAYEQCALCYYEKIKKRVVEDNELQKLTYNMKDYFMKSVAISANLVAAIPDITEVWSSASSLKEVLLSEEKSKENLKQLAILSERLNNYKEAIMYYEDIINVEENKKEIPKHLVAVANNQMNDCNYIAAITVFDLARTHPEGQKSIDNNVYLKCLVEAAFQVNEQGHEKQLGCKYLTYALENASNSNSLTKGLTNDDSGELTDKDYQFDIYLLCGEEDEEMAGKVLGSLKDDFGLNVTLNSMDAFWGKPKLSERFALIDKCSYFVIFIAGQYSEDQLYQLSIEHIVLNKNNVVVVLENELTKAPGTVERFPKLVYTVTTETNEARLCWLKRLILSMLNVS